MLVIVMLIRVNSLRCLRFVQPVVIATAQNLDLRLQVKSRGWQGPTPQERRSGEGGSVPRVALSTPERFCIRRGNGVGHVARAINCEGHNHRTVSAAFGRGERRTEADRNTHLSAYQADTFVPLGLSLIHI